VKVTPALPRCAFGRRALAPFDLASNGSIARMRKVQDSPSAAIQNVSRNRRSFVTKRSRYSATTYGASSPAAPELRAPDGPISRHTLTLLRAGDPA
jgi:hypothetical protein